MKRNSIFYEFFKDGSYVSTGMRTLGATKITTGVDTVPTMSLVIPLEDLPEENMACYDIKIHIQVEGREKYVFWGVVDNMQIDYGSYAITLNLSHRIARMREWAMPSNYVVKNTNISHIISPDGIHLGSPSTVAYKDEEAKYDYFTEFTLQSDPKIEHTFSSTDKLSALQELVDATEKCHWYVDLTDPEGNRVVIGELGDETPVEISPNPVFRDECEGEDKRYVTMLTEPVYNVDYTDHFNRAIVFCGDIGEGVAHLTLKEIYDNPDLQEPGFPVGMYDRNINLEGEPEYNEKGKVINNEQIYKDNEIVAYANNTNREYYVTDAQQLSEDGGIVKNAVFQYSQLFPIPKLTETLEDGTTVEHGIMDPDRIEMAKRAYAKAIRELKAQRPEHSYQFNTTALPVELGVVDGCKLRLHYIKKITRAEGDEDCGVRKEHRIADIDVSYYMINRIITFDEVLNEYATITLERDLKVRAIDAVEWELSEIVAESTPGKPSKINSSAHVKINHTTKYAPDDWDSKRGVINDVSG